MANNTVTVLGMVALLAFFTGCATETQTAPTEPLIIENNQLRLVDDTYPGLKLVLASEYLLGSIQIIDPKLGAKGQFSKTQVTVQNLTQNRYELEYQYQWEDDGGFSVGAPRPWNRFVLGPRELRTIPELALNQDAKQATFTVRLVDDSFIKEHIQPEGNQYNQP